MVNIQPIEFTRRQFSVVVNNGKIHPTDIDMFNLMPGEKIIEVSPEADIFDVLVTVKLFPSRGQAKKNWRGPGPEIPKGWFETIIGKFRISLAIWNPETALEEWI